MPTTLYIERLPPHSALAERFTIDTFPATVGRNPSNTVVVEEESVSDVHLRIEKDEAGQLYVVDCQSEKGTFSSSGDRIHRCLLQNPITLWLGEVGLRFQRLKTADPKPVSANLFSLRRLNRGCLFWILYLASITAATWANFRRPVLLGETFEVLSSGALPFLLGLPAWSAFWAFLGYVRSRQWNFFSHALLSVLVFDFIYLLFPLAALISFALDQTLWSEALTSAAAGFGIGYGISTHLRFAFQLPKRLARRAAIGIASIVWGVLAAIQIVESAHSPRFLPVNDTYLLPPVFRLTPSATAEDFIQGTHPPHPERRSLEG